MQKWSLELQPDTNYFFSLLGPRFDVMNRRMGKSLAKRFGGEWKPINIYNAMPNKQYREDAFLLVNNGEEDIWERAGRYTIRLPEYEDLNQLFVSSAVVSAAVERLQAQQSCIPVYSFTSSFFDATDKRFTLLGPDPGIATHYDSKINHYRLFEQLGLPAIPGRVLSAREFDRHIKEMIPCFVSSTFTSGGNESRYVFDQRDWQALRGQLRKVNRNAPILATTLLDPIAYSLNVNVLVADRDATHTLVVSRQIMRGRRYLGNLYPANISKEMEREIVRITQRVGDALSQEGFRGLFGLDFLVDMDGVVYVVDLNPRRQGGYACNALALEQMGVSLTDHELACALDGVTTLNASYEAMQFPHAWAHSKVRPERSGSLWHNVHKGSLEDVFAKAPHKFTTLFYEPGSFFFDGCIGYIAASGDIRDVEVFAYKRSDELLTSVFSPRSLEGLPFV